MSLKASSSKPHAPTGKELTEAIGLVLKDYEGPVDTTIVTNKLQAEHPNWKLPERRVNKFVKRFMNKHKNPAGADDDQTASMYKQSSSKRGGLLGIFSPSKRTNLVTDPAVVPEKETTETEQAVPDQDPTSIPKEEEATSPLPENGKEAVEGTNKDIAYETDTSVVESSHDCWGLSCVVM